MLDPSGLLAVAKLLVAAAETIPSTTASNQACLRRAISTAYYAVFHTLLAAAAQRFMGREHQQRPGASILYRGFSHSHMKTVCEAIQSANLKQKYRTALGTASVSKGMRDFATAFTRLQDHRIRADYHPTVAFEPSDAITVLDTAQVAIEAFDRADPAERADILALLLVGARG